MLIESPQTATTTERTSRQLMLEMSTSLEKLDLLKSEARRKKIIYMAAKKTLKINNTPTQT